MVLLGLLGLEIHPGPARAGNRPLVLEPELVFLQAAAGADLQLDRRLIHDAGVDPLEPVVEEAQLIQAAFLGVERMEVRSRMDAQLLGLACRIHEAFGVAAQMQADAGPVADAVQRHRDLVPLGASQAPELGIEIVAGPLPEHVVVECVWICGARPSHQMVRHVGGDPGMEKPHRKDAAMKCLIAIEIGAAFPGDDRLEGRRLQIGDAPLTVGVVGNAQRADIAGAPVAPGDPLDRIVEVHRFLVGAGIGPTG